ncbi:preprotein translocase subunit YajC [Nannocystis pusilla]|uniref:preprotein translocase subunit YajC n=1 Tax=Nannocystis pusilla TaxID=889268 RepID=UPI003B7D8FBF
MTGLRFCTRRPPPAASERRRPRGYSRPDHRHARHHPRPGPRRLEPAQRVHRPDSDVRGDLLHLDPPDGQAREGAQGRLDKLAAGDTVRLTGGIIGRISSLDGPIAMVEVAERVKLKVLRAEIADRFDPEAAASKPEAAAAAPSEEFPATSKADRCVSSSRPKPCCCSS